MIVDNVYGHPVCRIILGVRSKNKTESCPKDETRKYLEYHDEWVAKSIKCLILRFLTAMGREKE